MPWYYRVRNALNTAAPFLVPTQTANLALLVSAILKKQTLCLSEELARAYPTPQERRVASPKHDLLHRIKRLWRFTNNERVDALAVQLALVPHTVACLGFPRLLGLAIDWTFFDTTLPSGQRMRYQVLRKDRCAQEGESAAAAAIGLRSRQPESEQEPEPDRKTPSWPSSGRCLWEFAP